jgi:hypothetical protein
VRRLLFLLLLLSSSTEPACRKPEPRPTPTADVATLEKTRDELRARLLALRNQDPQFAQAPPADILVGLPVAFSTHLVRQVLDGFLSQIEIVLEDLDVRKEDEVHVKSFVATITPGAYKLHLKLHEARALLRPGAPTLAFKGNRLAISLPVSLAEGQGRATLDLDWTSRGIGAAVCDDFHVSLPVTGRVKPASYAVNGAFVLKVEKGALVAKPELRDLVVHLAVDPSAETWKAVDGVIAERSWKCEKVLSAINLPRLLKGVLDKGFDVRVPASLIKTIRLPAAVEESVTLEGRTYALSGEPVDLRITPDLLWFGARVRAVLGETPAPTSTPNPGAGLLPAARFLRASTARLGLGQPAAAQLRFGNTRQVGLDVEDGRAVEHVDASDVEPRPVAPQQLDDGEGDRVRPPRRAGGEDAVRSVVDGRHADEAVALGSVEDPEHEEVREALDVREPRLEVGPDVEDALGLVLRAGAFRDLRRVVERAPHAADRLEGHAVARRHTSALSGRSRPRSRRHGPSSSSRCSRR